MVGDRYFVLVLSIELKFKSGMSKIFGILVEEITPQDCWIGGCVVLTEYALEQWRRMIEKLIDEIVR